jgi:hypothetical protein
MGWVITQAGCLEGNTENNERRREERLQRMLNEEVEEADKAWNDFEMEET